MTIEQTVRRQQRREFRERLPTMLGGALAAAILGAGVLGVALWATNPPPIVMGHGSDVQPTADAVLAGVASALLPRG